jgi:phosphoribosylanthranilate isomerase
MIEGIQIKVCGLTSAADAVLAAASGTDYLGFIFHPKSPRYLPLEKYEAMAAGLPAGHRVAVLAEPGAGDMAALAGAGFASYQVHFRHDVPLGVVESWSRAVGPENLWLAPKLPPGVDASVEWLALAGTVMLDTFDPNVFGGTGRTGDWPKFRRHAAAHPGKTWILSGGLNPANLGEALAGTGARFVDVNSGVEASPGIKDPAKLKAFFAAVADAARH